LYILMFKFFDSNWKDRRFWAEWSITGIALPLELKARDVCSHEEHGSRIYRVRQGNLMVSKLVPS
jgi:hypothetical protein